MNAPSTHITIDTEIKAKRNNMISELITFRITKAKAKVKFGVKYLCGHECERSSVQLTLIRKRKRQNIFGTLISVSTVIVWEFIFQLHAHLLHKRIVSELFVYSFRAS